MGLTIIPLSERIDAVHFVSLRLHGHVLVDDPHPSLLRHGDRHAGIRHGVHSRHSVAVYSTDVAGHFVVMSVSPGSTSLLRGSNNTSFKCQCFLDFQVSDHVDYFP